MSKYFRYFPKVEYMGENVVNISKRVKVSQKLQADPYLFLPYTVSGDDRAEDIAYYYYGDASKVWMIYLANNIIDPYTQWPLRSDDFEKTIRAKYSHSITSSNIKDAMNNVTSVKHGFKTTDPVIYTSDDPVSGLTNGNTYYIIKTAQNKFKLATSVSNALSNVAIDIGSNSSDHTFTLDIEVFIQSEQITSNILYAENVNDGIRITYDTYRLDETIQPFDWKLVRVYEYENDNNESLRTIWLINRDYSSRVEKDLYEVMNA